MRSLTAVPIRLAQSLRWFGQIGRGLRRSRQGTVGLMIVIVHMLIAVTSPLIVPYSPNDIDGKNRLAAPSLEHPFGTDSFGRDLLSRTLLGGRAAIGVALLAAAIAVLWGGLLGILLAFIGGRVDEVAMRVIDALLAIPGLLVVLLIVVALGTGFGVLILTLGYAFGVSTVRIARGAALGYVARDFITAARARGERNTTIVLRELIPNLLDVLLVEYVMRASWSLTAISSLSYLGFGIAPPTPDWGRMVFENQVLLAISPWGTLFPVFALSSLIIGINLAGDALSKAIGLDRSQEAPT